MLILGIETSCDETSVAVVRDGRMVLCNVIASSRAAFAGFAGVIPEEAARQQVECMIPCLREALREAGTSPRDIDAIAVTKGPGLLGSLLVGTATARVLGAAWNRPVIGVHHTLGHVSSTWLLSGKNPGSAEEPQFPILTLSASGGHTDLWLRTAHLRGSLLGRTRDDAAGEAFDKGASILSLPYPGGPSIAKAAEGGDISAYPFPSPLQDDPTLDFSFSGLKTALKYLLRDNAEAARDLKNVAASYQHALCRHLEDRLRRALVCHGNVREVHVAGGVSANTHLRGLLGVLCKKRNIILRVPAALAYCTDNAAMIAAAGSFLFQELGDDAARAFETRASLPLEETLLLHGD